MYIDLKIKTGISSAFTNVKPWDFPDLRKDSISKQVEILITALGRKKSFLYKEERCQPTRRNGHERLR